MKWNLIALAALALALIVIMPFLLDGTQIARIGVALVIGSWAALSLWLPLRGDRW